MVLESYKPRIVSATTFLLLPVCCAMLMLTPSSGTGAACEVALLEARYSDVFSVRLKHRFADKEIGSLNGFDPTGRVFVTINQGSVSLWDTETGKLKLTLRGYKETVVAYFVQDGGTVVTTGKDKGSKLFTTKFWDAGSGALRASLDGFIVFGPAPYGGGGVTAITTNGKELKFWNAITGELKKTVEAHTKAHTYWGFALESAISGDGRFAVGYRGKSVPLWDVSTGALIADLKPTQDKELFYDYRGRTLEIEQAKFAPNGQTIATVDSYNRVELWQATTGVLKATLTGHVDSIYNIKFSADSRLLATASRDGTAKVWDVAAGQPKHTLKAGHQIARRVEFGPDATILAVGYQNRARLWDVNTGQLRAELPEDKDISKRTFFGTYLEGVELRFSPDGRLLLTMSDKTVKAWDAQTGQLITTLQDARPPLAFSPNGKLLATARHDKSVLLWEVSSQ